MFFPSGFYDRELDRITLAKSVMAKAFDKPLYSTCHGYSNKDDFVHDYNGWEIEGLQPKQLNLFEGEVS